MPLPYYIRFLLAAGTNTANSGFDPHKSIISQLCRSQSSTGPTRLKSPCAQGSVPFSRLWGRIHFLAPSSRWQNFPPWVCRTEFLFLWWRLFSTSGGHPHSWGHRPRASSSKPAMASQAPLTPPISPVSAVLTSLTSARKGFLLSKVCVIRLHPLK